MITGSRYPSGPEKDTTTTSPIRRHGVRRQGARSTELLWRIRALAAVLHGVRCSGRQHVERLLSGAIAARCPLEIATVVGAAAELRIYPTEAQMALCHAIAAGSGDVAVRAAIWVVHHRLCRARQR